MGGGGERWEEEEKGGGGGERWGEEKWCMMSHLQCHIHN